MTSADWTVIDRHEVGEVIAQAVGVVARRYDGLIEADDLKQEAEILCALNAARVRTYLDTEGQGMGYLYTWIRCRLTDKCRQEAARARRLVPLSGLEEQP